MKTEASEISPVHHGKNGGSFNFGFLRHSGFGGDNLGLNVRIAADSTMFLIVNLFMALSLGVQREQLEHRLGLTWPRAYRRD